MKRIVVASVFAAGMGVSGAARADMLPMPGGQCITALPRAGQGLRDWSPIVLAPCAGSEGQQYTWTGRSYQLTSNPTLCVGWTKFRDNEPFPLILEFCQHDRTFVHPDKASGKVFGATPTATSRCWIPTQQHPNTQSTVGMGACSRAQAGGGAPQPGGAAPQTGGLPTLPVPGETHTIFLQLGQWQIQKIYRGAYFDRCRAVLGVRPNQVQITRRVEQTWHLSVPANGLRPNTRHAMTIDMGRASNPITGVVASVGTNLTGPITDDVVNYLRSSPTLSVVTPTVNGNWQLGNAGTAIGAVEYCVKQHMGDAPPPKTATPTPAPTPTPQPAPTNTSGDTFTVVQQIGPWTISLVHRNRNFHECRARISSGGNNLYVAKGGNSRWRLAVPARGLQANMSHAMEIEFGRASQPVNGRLSTDRTLLWGDLTDDMVNYLRSAGQVAISTPTNNGQFSLTNVSAAIGAVEDCFNQNLGSTAGPAPTPNPAPGGAPRPGAITYNLTVNGIAATMVLTHQRDSQGILLRGTSHWSGPPPRTDPISGRIIGTWIVFSRKCTGQGYVGPCLQNYSGQISGKSAKGAWNGTGGPGQWSMTWN